MRHQLLSQALRMSFLDGSIRANEYNNGKVTEEDANYFMPLKVNTSIRNSSVNHKIQLNANKLVKCKLRIFSLSKESRYGNAQKKMNSTTMSFKAEKSERPDTRMSRNIDR